MMTNLDRIHSFGGYDMAKLLNDFDTNGACHYCVYGCCHSDDALAHNVDCRSGLYTWLMLEAKE